MSNICQWHTKEGFFLDRLERHAVEVVVVTYHSKTGFELGKPSTAIERRAPTLSELKIAVGKMLGLSQQVRFGYCGPITGVLTTSRDKDGFVTEHVHLFNKEFVEATGEDLLNFSLSHLPPR